jgi:predicted transcriptional regulator
MSVSDTLNAISDDKSLILFNTVALEASNSGILKTRLELTRKQYYSRMYGLVNAGLVTRKNGNYFLSSFGKVVYEALMLIDKGIQDYWKLKAIDSIESSPGSPQLPAEEYNRLISTLIECNEIKDILIRNNTFADRQKEKVYKSQESVVLAAPALMRDVQFNTEPSHKY